MKSIHISNTNRRERNWPSRLAATIVNRLGAKPRGRIAQWFRPEHLHVQIDSTKEVTEIEITVCNARGSVLCTTRGKFKLTVQDDETLSLMVTAFVSLSRDWLGGDLLVNENATSDNPLVYHCHDELPSQWHRKRNGARTCAS